MAEAHDQQKEVTGKKEASCNNSHSPVWSLLSNAQRDWGTTCRSILLIVGPLAPVLLTVVLIHGSLAATLPWVAGIGTMLGVCRYAATRSGKNSDPPNQQP